MNTPQPEKPIIVMGVSGAGKSTVAKQLAQHIGGIYIDADDLHSNQAKQKMASGQALTDTDRAPWLNRVGHEAANLLSQGKRPVIACSALRHAYRTALTTSAGTTILFIHLDGDQETLTHRLTTRTGHFMPTNLLTSQLATLEPLHHNEEGFRITIDKPLTEIINTITERL